MDDIRIWTDPRDNRVWGVKTHWGGQAMGVGMKVDISKIPAHPAPRRIAFIPSDGRGPIYRWNMGEDQREAEDLSDEELQGLLDEARA